MTLQDGNINEAEKYFENKVFLSKESQDVLNEWMKANDGISLSIISRKAYNDKKGDFLEYIGGKKEKERFTLYLPNDITDWELPRIMKKINQITFGNNLPQKSSTKTLQYKLLIQIHYLSKSLSLEQQTNHEELKRTIKNFISLYESYYEDDNSKKLLTFSIKDANFVEKINKLFERNNQRELIEYGKQQKLRKLRIATKEQLDNIKSEVSNTLVQEFYNSFFDRGKSKLSNYMKTFTLTDFNKLAQLANDEKYKLGDGSKIDKQTRFFLDKKGTNDIVVDFKISFENLDKTERNLREAIGIDRLKYMITSTSNSEQKILAQELAAKKILLEIFKYPRNRTNDDNQNPSHILYTKEMQCVGKSILGHIFLDELGIKHNGLQIPSHNALSIYIGGKSYLFDPTNYIDLLEIKNREDGNLVKYTKELGQSSKITLSSKEKLIIIEGDADKVLQSSILHNIGCNNIKNNPNIARL